MISEKKDIRSLSKEDLRVFFESIGDKAFRGNQVYEWLWSKASHNFEDMTNVSKETRQMLETHFVINHIKVDDMQRSSDGTVKNAVRLHDGLVVESVLIPTGSRTTACVSSQVGCSLDCSFCATARLKKMRNLNPDEIFYMKEFDHLIVKSEYAKQLLINEHKSVIKTESLLDFSIVRQDFLEMLRNRISQILSSF